MKYFIEDNMVGTEQGARGSSILESMQESLNENAQISDMFNSVQAIAQDKDTIKIMTEGAKSSFDSYVQEGNLNRYQMDTVNQLKNQFDNVNATIIQEAAAPGAIGNLSPILMNSYGVQERSYIGAHLTKVVKNVTAKADNFKISERKPFIVDIAGNKYNFIDAFAHDSALFSNIKETADLSLTVPSKDINMYTDTSTATSRIFGFDSVPTEFTITDSSTSPTSTNVPQANITITKKVMDIETGAFRIHLSILQTGTGTPTVTAIVSGQFDMKNGKLVYISATTADVTAMKWEMVISPETHHKALKVGYNVDHTPVNIPVGEHIEYNVSEEFKDASETYYNVSAMATLSNLMGIAIEQMKDGKTLNKFKALGDSAILSTTFDCTPSTGFNQGKEEYIKREFHPFMERVAISLKTKANISDCHFRVCGNPQDMRIPASESVEYITKRNQPYMGDITLDYDFCVKSDVHTIFYLSSDRMPQGTVYMFLIPNKIEDNIITVNHYEYSTYISNKYVGSDSNLPTAMISPRYLTQEYFAVVAKITISNNTIA